MTGIANGAGCSIYYSYATGGDRRVRMKNYRKRDFPVEKIRRFLEPGPVVLISSRWKEKNNIMTLGWQTVMEFSPSLIGCLISAENHSFEMIRKSRECVINIPTSDMGAKVVGIGNTSGAVTDKFAEFNLTPQRASKVKAPLIKECHTSIECRVADTGLINKYNFFILEAVKVHSAATPKYPRTLHYTGDGVFMIPGRYVNYKKLFGKDKL